MQERNKIGLWGIVFFILSGLISIDGLTPLASIGPSLYTWWLMTLLFFSIPYVLIVCELSSTFPGKGGIYEWTLRGMGKKNAARVSWYYWINVPFWVPSVYLICSGILAELFMPELSLWGMIGIALVLVWTSVLVSNASLSIGNFVNVLGGISKVVVLIAFSIGGYMLIETNQQQVTEFTLETMQPSLDGAFKYAPTLFYMSVGFEMIACMGSNVEKPEKNIPLGILISFVVILLLYWFSTSSMILAIPGEELSLVGGLVQTMKILFGGSALGEGFIILLSLLAAFGLFSVIIPWIMAASRAAAEAASSNEMPAIFALKNKVGAPYGSNMLIGIISTIALVIYGLIAGSADDLFWSLFSFSSFLLFLTYFFFLISFVRLRITEPNVRRPFKVPGGSSTAILIATLPAITLFGACLLFVFPDILNGGIDWHYSSPSLIAITLSLAFIEFSISRISIKQQKQGLSSNI